MRKIFAVVILLAIFVVFGTTLVTAQGALSTPCLDIAGISIHEGNIWEYHGDYLFTGGVWDESQEEGDLNEDGDASDVFCQTIDDAGSYSYLSVGLSHIAVEYADVVFPVWVSGTIVMTPRPEDLWVTILDENTWDQKTLNMIPLEASWYPITVLGDDDNLSYIVGFRGSIEGLGEVDLVLKPDGKAYIRTPSLGQQQ